MAKRRNADAPLDVELPITPMLDLAFQVLLFFVMTYHPSQLEGQMDLVLPDAAPTKAASVEEANPKQAMQGQVELPSEITVVVKTRHDGATVGGISEIQVQGTAATRSVAKLDELRQELEKARSGLSNQEDIKIQADSGLRYAAVMEVIDTCMKAKFKNVSFGPPPDLGGE